MTAFKSVGLLRINYFKISSNAPSNLERVRLGIFRNKNVFRNIFRLLIFCSWKQNSQNGIQVFRNENSSQTNAYLPSSNYSYSGLIPNERALNTMQCFKLNFLFGSAVFRCISHDIALKGFLLQHCVVVIVISEPFFAGAYFRPDFAAIGRKKFAARYFWFKAKLKQKKLIFK